ncbi:GGDEF domain-containing protein [Shewanella sp. 1_MG-2023]|uniref:GGDEF domain-containing protein n=1 Tax=unclassified Shewanella TaxID=196818 RepID=UPI0026E3C09B|nr:MULTISPECIES: GGDEF domain-containing protein [unclassified Shewanella]MDO6612798.1 GGDEF domain-containing protein [Shewanella sp. 7_MG-2023]MDO6772759.1 GGDEF domain-containing protein [Shewanella sp. 2_MG-2023]MDO6794923.1 GGDEF domain-containing protein [Shewanella sp. 1_MG-2023]
MIETSSSLILIQVICILCFAGTIAWTVMVIPMRVAPSASWRFALANFCVLLGMLLYTQRTHEPSYLHWLVADNIILVGFCFLRWGAQRLYHLKSSHQFDITLVLVSIGSMLLAKPQNSSSAYLMIILSLAAAICFFMLAKDHYVAFKKNFTAFATYWLVIPILIIGIMFLSRACILILYPEKVATYAAFNTEESVPILWVYIVLILLVNILIIGNTINRLVVKIMTLANKDTLTGLWNRNALQSKLALEHARWLRDKVSYSVILIDLDHFKQINDVHGHTAGDEVLKVAAKQLNSITREIDYLCRYGGEEFVLILPLTSEQKALCVANKLQLALAKVNFEWQGTPIAIEASIGFSTINESLPAEALLQLADKAMYEAKASGRNCIKSANPTLNDKF